MVALIGDSEAGWGRESRSLILISGETDLRSRRMVELVEASIHLDAQDMF